MLLGFSVWICYPIYHVCRWFDKVYFKNGPGNNIKWNDKFDPFIKHKYLSSKELIGKDLLIMGDVHGCYDEMQALLSKARLHTSKSLLVIFAGDMLRKGPKNQQVLNFLKSNSRDIFCVRGNHEQSILKKIHGDDMRVSEEDVWLKTLTSSDIEFLSELPYTISVPDLKITVVHAGLVPNIPLHLQEPTAMLNMRSLILKEDIFHGKVRVPSKNGKMGVPWARLWNGPNHVYFGHDAQRKLQFYSFATGLDSGCVYGGNLSSILISLTASSTGKIRIDSSELLTVNSTDTYVFPKTKT